MSFMRYQPKGRLRADLGSALAGSLRLAVLPGVARAFDAATQRSIAATGVKPTNIPLGLAGGFGAALGAGTTDKIVTGLTGAFPAAGRSYYFRASRNGTGGGGLGRLFDKTNGSAGQALLWSAGVSTNLVYFYFTNGTERDVPVPGTAATGQIPDVLVTHRDTGTSSIVNVFVGGVQVVFDDTQAGTLNDAAGTALTIGNRNSDNARVWDGLIENAYVWDRIVSPSEAAALTASRYQVLVDPNAEDEDLTIPGGAINTPVTPGSGALSLVGYAPTITQPHAAVPGAGTVGIVGYAPQVSQAINLSVAPKVGQLTVSGFAPSVARTTLVSVSPASGTLGLTGYAPTIVQSAPVINLSVRFDRLPRGRIDMVHFSST